VSVFIVADSDVPVGVAGVENVQNAIVFL